jgi:hypothetical protein
MRKQARGADATSAVETVRKNQAAGLAFLERKLRRTDRDPEVSEDAPHGSAKRSAITLPAARAFRST